MWMGPHQSAAPLQLGGCITTNATRKAPGDQEEKEGSVSVGDMKAHRAPGRGNMGNMTLIQFRLTGLILKAN